MYLGDNQIFNLTLMDELKLGGLASHSQLRRKLSELGIIVKDKGVDEADLVKENLFNKELNLFKEASFTPYFSAQPCSARCWFCSENLKYKNEARCNSQLRPIDKYSMILDKTLSQLRNISMNLSISGLEFSDDIGFFEEVTSSLLARKEQGLSWKEVAAYTNLSGFYDPKNRSMLVGRLLALEIDRLEVSRHHHDSRTNQKIMHFRSFENQRHFFENVLSDINSEIEVTLVCILQNQGVKTVADIISYLAWAKELNVSKVIFRTLSELDQNYQSNLTSRSILNNVINIEQLLFDFLRSSSEARVTLATNGYYY